ncbi:MAG: Rqc2 family fibronectin-binding protein [Bacillota bacterium]
MSFDGIVMRAVSLELDQLLCGARIDKIYQPLPHEIIILLRQKGQNYKLLISAHAQEARIHLVTQSKPNPAEPPLFCMVLRKHLEGGKIVSITQQGLERVLDITCEVMDELGDLVTRKLMVEIMGRHSNIILINPQNNKILDAIHRVPHTVSRYRQVLPGLPYQAPPPQKKINPWEVNEEEFYARFLANPLSQPVSKAILNTYSGLGPQTVEIIITRGGLNPSLPLEYCGQYELTKLWLAFKEAAYAIYHGSFTPEVLMLNKKTRTFSALALTHFTTGERISFPTMNEALDYFYRHKEETNTFQQKKADIEHLLKKEIERCEKKAGLQEQTVLEAQDTEKYRLWGELLMAHLHQLKPGKEVQVINYYSPASETLTIPLDEHLSVLENAQVYFNKYQKAKNAAHKAKEHLAETRAELDYLYSLSASLDTVTSVQEVDEIKEEFREAGYLKTVTPQKGKIPVKENTSPQKVIVDGWEIYYGKNNKQNDLLTMKMAKADDVWLHTKDIPGSHVIIKNPEGKAVPDNILEAAALLAAYHSKVRNSTHVPIDYTLRKHVRKPKGAKPGMVIYDNQRTIYITPELERIKNILGE